MGWKEKSLEEGFPSDSVVKNLSANAKDTGLVPGLERPHMVQSNEAYALQLKSLCSRAWESQLLSTMP